jgi:release factor glutamine methyltransferase
LELGVGSGAVVEALARELSQVGWVAVDISAGALEVARGNARRHGVAERVSFLRGNLLSGFKPGPWFAMLVANLPYVSEEEWEALPKEIRDYEPKEALLGGADGLALLRPLAQEAHHYLKPGGWLALEVGLGQAETVQQILRDTGAYEQLEIIRDYGGIERVVRARTESGN